MAQGKVVPIRVTKAEESWNKGAEVWEHDAFGMVGTSRFTTSTDSPGSFFGSSIKHSSGISLVIRRAKQERSLNRERYVAEGPQLIAVKLTAAQFAEMITTLNVGDGVPCTIERVNGETMPLIPSPRKLYETSVLEVDEHLTGLKDKVSNASDILRKMMTGELSMTKANLKLAQQEVGSVQADLGTNMEFLEKSLVKRVEKQMAEAKANFESYRSQSIESMGLEAFHARNEGLRLKDKLVDDILALPAKGED